MKNFLTGLFICATIFALVIVSAGGWILLTVNHPFVGGGIVGFILFMGIFATECSTIGKKFYEWKNGR